MTLAERWDLWRRDPEATIFQSPAWVEAWWREFGREARQDVEARDPDGRLAAWLPLTIWRDGPVRRLIPVAAGTSDYSDAVFAPAAGRAALDQIWSAVDQLDWDEALLPDLRPGSRLNGPIPPAWSVEEAPGEICPVLEIPEDGRVLAALSKSRRRKIAHDRNRAAALGGVEESLAGTDELEEALEALFTLHAARWARVGRAGVLGDPSVRRFLSDAARRLDAAGLLRMSLVRHDGRITAVVLGAFDGRRGLSYINGVDMSRPEQSFGTLAFARLIETTAAEGAREFHFLRGDEPYKRQWGAEPRRTVRRLIRRRA